MSYSAVVLADNPLYYWRLDAASGNELNQGTGPAVTLNPGTSPPTQNVSPNASYTSLNGKCWQFDGTNDFGKSSAGIGLSSYNAIAVEFILYWDVNANDNDQLMETGAEITLDAGKFKLSPNWSGGGFLCSMTGSKPPSTEVGVTTYGYFTRPSAAAWHHYVILFDLRTATITPYVDGAEVSFTTVESATDQGLGFGEHPLYLMSRTGSTFFGAGKVDEIALYGSPLTSSQIGNHYDALFSVPGTVNSPFTFSVTTNGKTIAVPTLTPLNDSSLIFTPIT